MPILPHLPIWLHSDWSFITLVFCGSKHLAKEPTAQRTMLAARLLKYIYIPISSD